MRALTLLPPWSHAVTWLGKRCENRKLPIPDGLLGQRIAIHAGATLPKGWNDDLRAAAPGELLFVVSSPPGPCFVGYGDPLDVERRREISNGPRILTRAIVATAVLAACVDAQEDEIVEWQSTPGWLAWRDTSAAYWWRLDAVRRLVDPVPFPKPLRGQLGLWHLDRVSPEIDERVRRAEWVAA